MTNLDRATKIRRTVANKAYELLKNCKDPEPAFDGYDEYLKEHWEIDYLDLEYEVIIALDKIWEFEEGDDIDKQIKFHCKQFMESEEYDDLKDRVRDEFYEYEAYKQDIEATNRAHMPTWTP